MAGKNLPSKVFALYTAVEELIAEDIDIKEIKVSDITRRAGIGKGTAYEYFKNKEEIISSAILYHIDSICRGMMKELDSLDGFPQMIGCILETMDEKMVKRGCLLKYIHLLTDNSPISKILRQRIKERKGNICLPHDIIQRLIQAGADGGVIDQSLPSSYIEMEIASRLMTYAAYYTLQVNPEEQEAEREQLKELIVNSLLKSMNIR